MLRIRVVGVVAWAGCLAGAVVLSALAPASAVAAPKRPAPAGQVVLRSSFQPMKPIGQIVTSGDYLLLGTRVINTRLGTTIALPPQCEGDALGPPWVLMSCRPSSNPSGPSDLELYSLADGTRQTVTPSAGLPPQCPQGDINTECVVGAAGVGAYWIRWDASCYHCSDTPYFQNIQTGAVRDDPTNATTYADLNSPALAHTTCPGVQVLRESMAGPLFVPYEPRWGSLTPDGQFALAIGTSSAATAPLHVGAFLERCGTTMRRLLVSAHVGGEREPTVVSNASAVVWQATPSQLSGLFLPSLETFTIALPPGVVASQGRYGFELALTSAGLYMRDLFRQTLWQTAAPTALPRNITGPTVTRSGNTLTCARGDWRNAVSVSYAWRVNGRATKGAEPRLAVGKARKGRGVSCSVTASNAAGTTTASSTELHLR